MYVLLYACIDTYMSAMYDMISCPQKKTTVELPFVGGQPAVPRSELGLDLQRRHGEQQRHGAGRGVACWAWHQKASEWRRSQNGSIGKP